MTLRHVDLLWKQHAVARRASERTMEIMLGQLIAMVGNTGFRGFTMPVKAEHFMPSEWKAKPAKKERRRTRAQIADSIRGAFADRVR